MDKLVVCELMDAGMIDTDLLVRVVQVMTIPEFGDFFNALGEIDLTDIDQSAAILSETTTKLVRSGESAFDLS